MPQGEEYLDLFFDEVNTNLDSLSQQLSKLEKSPASAAIINEIFRIVHTVKGMAATVGFNSVAKLCHKMEELFDFFRKNPGAVPEPVIQCQIKALDSLFKIIEYISNSGEEQSICRTLSEAITKEIEAELAKLSNKSLAMASAPASSVCSANDKQIEIKVQFSDDCLMPGVRAFMTAQVLEKAGELVESDPPKEHFLDNMEIISHGLKAVIRSSKSVEQIQDRLMKISDVVKVEIAEKRTVQDPTELLSTDLKTADIPEVSSNEKFDSNNEQSPEELEKKLSDKQRTDLVAGTLKGFKVDLALTDEVSNVEEQFLNLINNLNDYLGQVIYSSPSLKELEEKKRSGTEPQKISNILTSQLSSQKQKLHFVLLINGTHKNILDFLSDACELNKVEVKEIEFPGLQKEIKGQPDNALEQELKKAQTEEVKDLSFTKSGDVKTAFVRVNMATLESLMNSVGELVINHNRIKLAIGETATNEERSIIQYLHQVTTKIQQLVMSVRMVPVNQVFSRFPRFIRDISRELKKEVNLVLEGEETEIDRLMVDELNEIFIHLVRNAIDHGIEKADDRETSGKARAGKIKMSAYSQGNNVFITIQDDGRGIDPQNIKKKAVQKGLLTSEQADNLSSEELLDLIFTTGFSTAEQVSDLSGRGVGMDVVKSRVSSLGGQIFINSVAGEGTSVRLAIPSTISIIQALLIDDRNGLYAIPLTEIKEIVKINTREIYEIGYCQVIVQHNETIPILNLHKYLDYSDQEKEADVLIHKEFPVVVVTSEGKNYGLIVDALVGQQEIVIKPISNRANQEGLVNGATVFGDGRVAMIVNIDQVIKAYLREYEYRESSWGNPSDGMGSDPDDGVLSWASRY